MYYFTKPNSKERIPLTEDCISAINTLSIWGPMFSGWSPNEFDLKTTNSLFKLGFIAVKNNGNIIIDPRIAYAWQNHDSGGKRFSKEEALQVFKKMESHVILIFDEEANLSEDVAEYAKIWEINLEGGLKEKETQGREAVLEIIAEEALKYEGQFSYDSSETPEEEEEV